jgi:GT2 family glycosyltransferase
MNSDDELERAIREREILAAENDRLQRELREATEKYTAIRSSLSWKLTAPLRSAMDWAMAVRGRSAPITHPLELNHANYQRWVLQYDQLTDADRAAIKDRIAKLKQPPLLSLVMVVHNPPAEALKQTIQSIRRQIYQNWEVFLVDDASTAPHVARTLSAFGDDPRVRILRRTSREGAPQPDARGDFLGFLDAGDVLAESALFEIAAEIDATPDADLVYTDEDELNAPGERCNPRFKTDWNPDLLLEQDYLGKLTMRRREWKESPRQARHIPAVLCHRGLGQPDAAPPERRSLTTHAKVSVIIPTRDRAELLERCLEGLLHRTDYPAMEILVVDNGSKEPRTREVLEKYQVQVLAFPGEFNWSAMNNAGAKATTGEVLLFLNNDTDVIDAGWLAELASQAMRPEIGAVGAKLLFADGTVQHAGIWLGPGGRVRHFLRLSKRDEPGYLGQLAFTRDLSAVTGACMAVRREAFEEVGGFDESFPVSYSDIDLCLKLRQRGYRILWTPHAELLHLESASRGSGEWRYSKEEEEHKRFVAKWEREIDQDPFFSPNLDLIGEEKLALAFPPRRWDRRFRLSCH